MIQGQGCKNCQTLSFNLDMKALLQCNDTCTITFPDKFSGAADEAKCDLVPENSLSWKGHMAQGTAPWPAILLICYIVKGPQGRQIIKCDRDLFRRLYRSTQTNIDKYRPICFVVLPANMEAEKALAQTSSRKWNGCMHPDSGPDWKVPSQKYPNRSMHSHGRRRKHELAVLVGHSEMVDQSPTDLTR